jgi:hypothetical protein
MSKTDATVIDECQYELRVMNHDDEPMMMVMMMMMQMAKILYNKAQKGIVSNPK